MPSVAPIEIADADRNSVQDSPPRAPASIDGGLAALFARISRAVTRVILPINDTALDDGSESPAFYCVHSLSGAGGTDFLHLAKLMPTVRFYGIQAPPAKMHDPTFGSSVESLADDYVDALIKFQPTGRFFLGGWSAGVIIGLEIAQKLRVRGRVVSLFAAIDATPENTSAGFPAWHPRYLLDVAGNSLGWFINDVVMTKGSRSALMRRGLAKGVAQARALLARCRGERQGGADPVEALMDVSRYPAVERSFMTRLYAALLAYQPKKYAGRVVAYEATKRPLLHLPQVGRVWTALAPNATIVRVKGTHLSILKPGDVDALAADLARRIADIAQETADRPAAAAASAEAPPDARKSA